MNNQISVLVNRYLVSVLIAVFGLIMLFVGFNTEQSALYLIASFNLFVGGALAVLFSAGVLKRGVVMVIGVVCIVATIFIGASAYQSVQRTIAHNEARAKSETLVRFSLTQIRDIQRAHRKTHGRFAADWEELIDFFNNGEVEIIEAEKSVPTIRLTREEVKIIYNDNRAMDRNMNEQEAAFLASLGNPTNNPELVGFKRDTVVKPYKEEFLGSISRIKEMQKLGINNFDINDLRYIPMTDPREEWVIETRDSVPYASDTIPTIRVEGLEPIALYESSKRQIIGFGSLKSNSDKASWE